MTDEYPDYIIIRAFTIEDLEKAVNMHIQRGRVPVGGVSEVYVTDVFKHPPARERYFAQAMIRKEAMR